MSSQTFLLGRHIKACESPPVEGGAARDDSRRPAGNLHDISAVAPNGWKPRFKLFRESTDNLLNYENVCLYCGSRWPMTKTFPDPIRPNAGVESNRQKQTAGWRALRPLPEGPLDIVGDVHGEIDALRMLIAHLGYDEQGNHPQGRRLVFVGDLVDRGPDSPGVVRLVAQMVGSGVAFAVMGNHDLNILNGRKQGNNAWYFEHGPVKANVNRVAGEDEAQEIRAFLLSLPLALERSDLRVVHAYWNEAVLRQFEGEPDAVGLFQRTKDRLDRELASEPDELVRTLAHQNRNPTKLITSGPEGKARSAFFADGKRRMNARLPWWDDYDEEPVVVFGHYWRLPHPQMRGGESLMSDYPLNSMLGRGSTICVDYSVGSRFLDREAGVPADIFHGRLAALRWPERELVFDNGEQMPVIEPALVS